MLKIAQHPQMLVFWYVLMIAIGPIWLGSVQGPMAYDHQRLIEGDETWTLQYYYGQSSLLFTKVIEEVYLVAFGTFNVNIKVYDNHNRTIVDRLFDGDAQVPFAYFIPYPEDLNHDFSIEITNLTPNSVQMRVLINEHIMMPEILITVFVTLMFASYYSLMSRKGDWGRLIAPEDDVRGIFHAIALTIHGFMMILVGLSVFKFPRSPSDVMIALYAATMLGIILSAFGQWFHSYLKTNKSEIANPEKEIRSLLFTILIGYGVVYYTMVSLIDGIYASFAASTIALIIGIIAIPTLLNRMDQQHSMTDNNENS